MQRITVAESKIEQIINDESSSDDDQSYIQESEIENSGEADQKECSHESEENKCPKALAREERKK